MRIAVPYDNGAIYAHFGKTESFQIFEAENHRVISTEMISAGALGHSALAGVLADANVDVVLCGGIGSGAESALWAENIEIYSGLTGDIGEAVEKFLRGELIPCGENVSHGDKEEASCGCDCENDGEEDSCGCSCGSGCGGCHTVTDITGPNVGKTCRVHYRGTFDNNEQFDSSYDRNEPLEFVCGAGMMIQGFDRAVAQMEAGQTVKVHLTPKEAYGEKDPNAVFELEIAQLPGAENLNVADRVYLYNSFGQPFPVTVLTKDEEHITFDANHEMAGKELNFEITLLEVL